MAHPAIFNDGMSALRHNVACEINGQTLEIRSIDGVLLDRWPLAAIRSVDGLNSGRFRQSGRNARLTLTDDDDGAWLRDACPNLAGRRDGTGRWPVWTAAIVAATLSVTGIFLYLIPAFSGAVVSMVPYSFERRMGIETRDQIVSLLERHGGTRVCHAAVANEILAQKTKAVAAVMESPFDIEVTVLRFPVPNALTLPGGQIIVLSELIGKAQNGDELMGVLAHEIAHAVRRDPLQVSLKQTGTALLVSLMIGDVFGGTALTGVASTIVEGGYSRDAEAAADAMAVDALNRLGLTARPLADFLARLGKEGGGDGIPSFLSTHPSGTARQAAIEKRAQGLGRAFNAFEWRRIKGMCDRPG